MTSPPDLRATQELLWSLITAPEGVEKGVADLATAGRLSDRDLSFLVRGDERLGPAARVDIYANMYFYRLRDCLLEDFPKLAAVLGTARFHNLVTDYLLAHPPSHPSLRWLGARLPAFLETHSSRREFPFLAALAELEWARADVFDEEDCEPLSRDTLTALDPARLEGLRFEAVPALRLLALPWSVAPLWRQIEETAAGHEPAAAHSAAVDSISCERDVPPLAVTAAEQASAIRVWRRGQQVLHRTVPLDEEVCLREITRAGASLPRLCELVLDRQPPAERREKDPLPPATRRMAEMFDLWLEDGILRRPA